MSTASTTTVKEALPDALAKARANKPRSLWSDALRRLLRNKAAVLGLLFITLEIVVALSAPLVAPYHFAERTSGATTLPPSREHLLGTDGQGRDVLSRLIYGARISLSVGFIAEILILCIGVPLGLLAGYFGR